MPSSGWPPACGGCVVHAFDDQRHASAIDDGDGDVVTIGVAGLETLCANLSASATERVLTVSVSAAALANEAKLLTTIAEESRRSMVGD